MILSGPMLVTPAYGAVFALVFVALSVRTLRLRREFRVAVGYGNEPRLERSARVHANFAEYVPLCLLLIYFVEIQSAAKIWVHVLCIVLLVGRLVHAYGVSQLREDLRFRVTGMALTFTVAICASIAILLDYF